MRSALSYEHVNKAGFQVGGRMGLGDWGWMWMGGGAGVDPFFPFGSDNVPLFM